MIYVDFICFLSFNQGQMISRFTNLLHEIYMFDHCTLKIKPIGIVAWSTKNSLIYITTYL